MHSLHKNWKAIQGTQQKEQIAWVLMTTNPLCARPDTTRTMRHLCCYQKNPFCCSTAFHLMLTASTLS
jgi:hypothetical protein